MTGGAEAGTVGVNSAFLQYDIKNERRMPSFWIPHFCGMTGGAEAGGSASK